MGFWDAVYSTGDRLKGLTPTLSTVKRAGDATYGYTSAAVTKIDQVVRVDGIQKLPQYWPDDATVAQIGLFTKILAMNAGKYALYEGFKHIPGVTVASKLVSESMREAKHINHKQGTKSVQTKRIYEKDLMKSTSQPENFKQNSNFSSQSAAEAGSEKTQDLINTFMMSEFVGNHMFVDLMVPKIAGMKNKND